MPIRKVLIRDYLVDRGSVQTALGEDLPGRILEPENKSVELQESVTRLEQQLQVKPYTQCSALRTGASVGPAKTLSPHSVA